MAATQVRTLCNRDCPDACGIVATVDEGRITRLQGDPDHPVTRGFLCFRTNQFLRTQYAADRVTEPLLRNKRGELVAASWDAALDFVAERLLAIRAESGPAAIFHYRSGGTLGIVAAQTAELFFDRFGPCAVKSGDICSGAGEAAQIADFGVSDSSDLDQLLRARHILVWGKNVCTSSPHTLPVLKDARAAGATVTLVDPVWQQTALACDTFIQPRPASDGALALAVARLLFERDHVDPDAASYCNGLDGFRALAFDKSVAAWCAEADVPLEAAERLAADLHDGPTTILVGWGMARRLQGGAIVRALDALGAISGNVGRPGAGVSYYHRRRRAFATLATGTPPRTVCEPLFAAELERHTDPPIRAVWVTGANPVAMLPDSHAVAATLARRELVVVADSWLSDTARLAHAVLPTPTLLEADELLGAYGHHHLGEARPVVAPPPGVKSDLEILQGLAERVGLGDVMRGSAAEWKERLVTPEARAAGVSLEALRGGVVRNPLAPRVIFEGRRFPTPDGRAQLLGELPPAPPAPDGYPLWLLSLSTARSQSSVWAKAPPVPNEVTVHPDAAGGVAHGALGELSSPLGSMTVRVLHDARQRRDVALVPKGGHLRSGACANAITRPALTDIGEGGALYDERVRLQPLS